MLPLDPEGLGHSTATLERAFEELGSQEPGGRWYEIRRSACAHEFGVAFDQAVTLLRRRLTAYFAADSDADELSIPNVFRHAARHGLIDIEACERWLAYRRRRGEFLSGGRRYYDEVLGLLPGFIEDARSLEAVIAESRDD